MGPSVQPNEFLVVPVPGGMFSGAAFLWVAEATSMIKSAIVHPLFFTLTANTKGIVCFAFKI